MCSTPAKALAPACTIAGQFSASCCAMIGLLVLGQRGGARLDRFGLGQTVCPRRFGLGQSHAPWALRPPPGPGLGRGGLRGPGRPGELGRCQSSRERLCLRPRPRRRGLGPAWRRLPRAARSPAPAPRPRAIFASRSAWARVTVSYALASAGLRTSTWSCCSLRCASSSATLVSWTTTSCRAAPRPAVRPARVGPAPGPPRPGSRPAGCWRCASPRPCGRSASASASVADGRRRPAAMRASRCDGGGVRS